jgi:hypothetical protein
MSERLQPTWGGPMTPTAAGVDLPCCYLCRRFLPHSWAEHAAAVEASSDPLAKAAGLPTGDAA